MAAAMKSMIVYVVDTGLSMKNNISNNIIKNEIIDKSTTKISLATSLILNNITQKVLTSKTMEFSVITYGNAVTSNHLNTTQGGYEDIEELVQMSKPNIETIKYLSTTLSNVRSSNNPSDLINGIIVGQDILMRYNSTYKFNRIMVLITDGETTVDGIEDIEQVIQQMKVNGCILNIVLIGKSNNSNASIAKLENVKLLQSCASTTNGNYLEAETFTDALELLSKGIGFSSRPQLTKILLEISSNLKIPCTVYARAMPVKIPSVKKTIKRNVDVIIDIDQEKQSIIRDKSYRNTNDLDEEVPIENRIKGFKYGSQYIPITPVEEELFILKSNSIIRVIGSLPVDKIPPHHLLSSAIVLQGSTATDSAGIAIQGLSKALNELSYGLLVRYVKKDNSDPFLGCLLSLDKSHQSLSIYRLPMLDDIREYTFPSFVKLNSKINEKKRKLVDSYIDNMTISSFEPVVNISYHTSIEWIRNNIINDINISNKLMAINNPIIVHSTDNNDGVIKELNQLFNITKITKASNNKKFFWSNIEVSDANIDTNVDIDKNDNIISTNNTSTTNSLYVEKTNDKIVENDVVIEISVSQPIDDFQNILNDNQMNKVVIHNAILKFFDVILQIITTGSSNYHYRKSMYCLKYIRSICVIEKEFEIFNQFLYKQIKPLSTSTHSLYWSMIQQDNITLITNQDDSYCNVTFKEGEDFLL